jgi:large subunit ribosomal protein L21
VAGDLRTAKVTGTITDQGRGKKILVYKFKKRKMYRRRQGHRQCYTQVKISDIAV